MRDYEGLAVIFAALANPTRLRLLTILARNRHDGHGLGSAPGVLELADKAEISRFQASFHLKQLRNAGIVARERVGARWAHSLTDQATDAIDEWLFDLDISTSVGPPM